jgi:hypothetical protein
MSRIRQSIFCLAATAAVFTATAQTPPPLPVKFHSGASNSILLPPLPTVQPPVTFFRQLLSMSPHERMNSLTNRTPEKRALILAKVREYQMLTPDERELRLRATELRWYLTSLFRIAPEARATRLAQVPEDLRDIVNARLAQWDDLPPSLQQEFLANDRALHSIAHVETTNNPPGDAEQQKIAEQFNQFFELTPDEKQQMLSTLSTDERAQMEKTLKSFDQLPAPQRTQCVRAFTKFAGMSAAERAEFLKNAESWSKLSPGERQTWRDLVTHVPQWPPLPPQLLMPPMPPKIPTHARPVVATNTN